MTAHSHTDTSRLVLDAEPQSLTLPKLLRSRQLRLFYGDLHNHTGFSDGTGRPEDALRQMRDRGLHFAAITDHGEFFDRDRAQIGQYWAAAAAQVAAFTSDEFVAIRGFEWSSPHQGHSNVWWSAEYTGYQQTGDDSMAQYYEWLADPRPTPGNKVLAGFNHPGREVSCFDGCMYLPALDERIVTLECFNRDDDYGATFFRALDNGWHVGAIGVSDHHGDDWGSPRLPRAGLLAPTLSAASIQSALLQHQVFATRSPTLSLLMMGNDALMGARLSLPVREPLTLGVWCDDPAAQGRVARLELWTNGGVLVDAHETNGLQQVSWRVTVPPQETREQWFVVRVLHSGSVVGYSSPIWAAWC
ncbi:MAG TPA: CehA/McbA family metallohydrolase [Herpetosiphonaceae bacterium]